MASLTAKRRRTEIARITDPAARLVTYSKRRKGLFNKASELSRLCGARVAVVVFSPAGKPCSFGDPSADEIISDYLRGGGGGSDGDGDGELMPPMGLTQWVEWVQTEWDACATQEDLESLILKYEAVRDCAREKLKALEDSHKLSEQEMDSLFESLEGQGPVLAALLTEGEAPENPAAGGGSSAVESTPAVSDLVGCGSNVAGGGSLGVGSTPNLSEDCIVDSHGFWSSPEDLAIGGGNLEDSHGFWSSPEDLAIGGGNLEDSHGFWSSPEDLAVGGGNLEDRIVDSHGFWSSPEDSAIDGGNLEDCIVDSHGGSPEGSAVGCGNLEDCFVDSHGLWSSPEDSAIDGGNLKDCFVGSHGFWSSPEDSAFCGGNSGVEPALSDLGEYGYNPNDFVGLEDLGVLL